MSSTTLSAKHILNNSKFTDPGKNELCKCNTHNVEGRWASKFGNELELESSSTADLVPKSF